MNKKFLAKLYSLWVFAGVVGMAFSLYNEELFLAKCYDVERPDLELRSEDGLNVKRNLNSTEEPQCISQDQCGNGWCLSNETCACKDGYVTKEQICDYRLSGKLAIFLLSFAYGSLGVDWFVLARGNGCYICAGVAKLLTLGGCCVWWLVDWIRVLESAFMDGNGMPLDQRFIA